MKKFFLFLGGTIVIWIIFYLIASIPHLDRELKQIGKPIKGVIIEKYFEHNYHVKVKTDAAKSIDIYSPSDDLIENSEVGDSLIKQANTNKCRLTNKTKNILIPCWAVSDELKHSKKYPKDMK